MDNRVRKEAGVEMWPKEKGVNTQCPSSSGKFKVSILLLEPLTPPPPLPLSPSLDSPATRLLPVPVPAPGTPAPPPHWLELGLGEAKQEAVGCRVSVSGGNNRFCLWRVQEGCRCYKLL